MKFFATRDLVKKGVEVVPCVRRPHHSLMHAGKGRVTLKVVLGTP